MSRVREPIWGFNRRLQLLQDVSDYLKGVFYRVLHKPLFNFALLSVVGIFFIISTVVYTSDLSLFRDSSNEVHEIQDDIVAVVMEILTFFGDSPWALLFVPLLYLGFTPGIGGRYTAVMVIVGYLTALLKIIIHEGRPFWMDKDVEGYTCNGDFGMPSGHSSTAMVMYLFLARELWTAMPGFGVFGDRLADIFYPNSVLDRKAEKRRKEEAKLLSRQAAREARDAEQPMLEILAKYRALRRDIDSKQRDFIEQHSDAVFYCKVVTTVIVRAALLVVAPTIIVTIGFSRWYLGAHYWMQALFGYILGLIVFLLWIVCENLLKRYHHNLINHTLFLQIVVWSVSSAFFLSIALGSWFATFYTWDIPKSWEENFEDDCSDDRGISFKYSAEHLIAFIVAMHAALLGHSVTTRVCVREWWRVGYIRRALRAIVGIIGTIVLFVPLHFGVSKDTYFVVRLVFGHIIPIYAAVFWVFGVMPWLASHCCCGRLGVKDFEWEETFARANVLYQETDEVSVTVDTSSSETSSVEAELYRTVENADEDVDFSSVSEVDEESGSSTSPNPSDQMKSLPPSTTSGSSESS